MTIKQSTTTALMGCIVMLIAISMFIWNIYFSTQPTQIRAENLIEALYILATSLGFMLLSLYFNDTGR